MNDDTIAILATLPNCDFNCSEKAAYDFRTSSGPWAYGCSRHYHHFRMHDTLGLGRGQRLVLAKEGAAG